jgi:hypothetical protein
MATATRAAGTSLQILRRRHTAEFKSLGDQLLYLVLQVVHFFLRVNKSFGHWISQKGVALGIESGDVIAIQRQPLMLALVEQLPLLAQALVLALRCRIRHEGLDPLANALKLGLPYNGFAQLHSLLANRVFDLGSSLHKFH